MDTGNTCTVSKDKIIKELKDSGEKPGKIAKIMDCPSQIMYNELAVVKK